MLAGKEFAMKTIKNLEQRIVLQCDGHVIHLPPLKGIVILNIPSFMGGANFWGTKSGNEVSVESHHYCHQDCQLPLLMLKAF